MGERNMAERNLIIVFLCMICSALLAFCYLYSAIIEATHSIVFGILGVVLFVQTIQAIRDLRRITKENNLAKTEEILER